MIALYDLAQEIGKADFLVALELAAEQQMYGAEYLRAILTLPSASAPNGISTSGSRSIAVSVPNTTGSGARSGAV